jgi:hypothetical protein
MIDDSKSIWLEHRTIMRARMEKNTELMREYDKTVYLLVQQVRCSIRY